MVSREVIATKMGFSQNIAKGVVSCYNITPMLTSDGMMSKRPGKGHYQGKVHTGTPGMCPYQATTLWQLDGLVDQGVNPNPCDGTTDSQDDSCSEETEINCALSAVEKASNSRLSM